jgi:aminopeptidase YwaD
MRFFSSLFFLLFSFQCFGQDIHYARKMLDTLASSYFQGRGYVNEGDRKAAGFIQKEFKDIGLEPLSDSYFQKFTLAVNTFPSEMSLSFEKKQLKPGEDFIVHPFSGSLKGNYKVILLDKNILENPIAFRQLNTKNFSKSIIVMDVAGVVSEEGKKLIKAIEYNPFNAKGIVYITDEKFTWSVSREKAEHVVASVKRASLPENYKSVTFNIKNKFIPKYQTQNVVGMVEGTQYPDSFIVFTAHYDHLGMMGSEACFYGANDNASGISVMLDMARHYKAKALPVSVVFIAFAAEEAGLIGSEFFVNNPMLDLKKIRFLINMDLMGNGDEGITIVNGSVFEEEFEIITNINNYRDYLPAINKRGKAANSDHYHFTEKGVPAFFMYTLGGSKAYHDIDDIPEQIHFPVYDEVFKLITEFVNEILGKR